MLQDHVLMAFHPPILYAGYVGFTIPFAFGIAALITGRVGEGWLVETRRWTLVAWGFLTTGIVLGSWWSYEVLGWGGYWAWDPVENASLLPWLTATAYLHSVIVQERRGMLRIWNLSLLGATFSLTILGTFFTRSGVLDSVHAFSESPIGPWLISAFGVIVAVTCGLIFWRADRLGSPGSIASPVSREAAFLANNVLFAAFAFVVLLGTVFPLLTEAINNNRISVGSPYFNSMVRPIGLLLLFMMAIAPVLQWKGTPLELVKERALRAFAVTVLVTVVCVAAGVRGPLVIIGFALATFVAASALRQIELSVRKRGLRGFFGRSNGGMVAHLGLAIVALGIVASQTYAQRAEFQIQPGQIVNIAGHSIEYVGLVAVDHPNRTSQVASVRIDGGQIYEPALSKFPNSTDAIGTPSVKTSFTEDVYVTLVRTPSTNSADTVISVVVTPMVSWLWGGGIIMAIGTVLALMPTAPIRRGPQILDVTFEEQLLADKKEMIKS